MDLGLLRCLKIPSAAQHFLPKKAGMTFCSATL